MNTKEIISEIEKLNPDSDAFFKIYKVVSGKMWTFDKPNEIQKCKALLVKFAEVGDDDKVILAVKIVTQLAEMMVEKTKAACITLGMTDGTAYHVDIYQDGIARDTLQDQLKQTAKAIANGNIKVKTPYGKNYFKKKEQEP